jgi:hypothetical protein
MVQILKNKIETEQEKISEIESDEAISSDNKCELDKETVAADGNFYVTGCQDKIWSRSQHTWNSGGFHPVIAALSRLKIQEAPPCEQGFFTNYRLFFFSSWM